MSHWKILPLARGLHAHASDWDRLNEQAFRSHPMLTSTFIDGLLAHFGDGNEKLCQYEENGLVRAMCIVTPRNKLLWSSFLPSQGQIGATLVPEAALLSTLFESLPATVMQCDLLCNDPDVGDVLRYSEADRRNHAFTMNVALDGTFEQYWASRPRHLQSNMRRYDKRLLGDGVDARYLHIAAPEQVRAAVERYARLEGAGWKGAKGSALASSDAQLQFYVELMTAPSAGQASVHELWLDDTLAASRLILTHGDTHVMLKTTYSEELAPYAPGRLLLRAVIRNAFSDGWRGNIEFCTDAPPDLLGWSTDRRWVQHASLYRSSLARKIMLGIRVLRKRRVALRQPTAKDFPLTTESFTHPDVLPADARKLMNRAERSHVEFGTAWYRNLVNTSFADDPGICFYTLRRDEKILAVLPLRAEKVLLGWRLHSLSNVYTTLYEPAFERGLKATDLGFLLTAIQRDFRGMASFKLAPMDPYSGTYQTVLNALEILGWHPFEYAGFPNWYQAALASCARPASEQAAPDAGVGQLQERFVAAGGRLELVREVKDMAAAVAALETISAASSAQPPSHFMAGLLRTYAEHGGLRLGLAWIGDTPVAAQAWIVAHGRAAIYPMVLDEAFKAYAPGALLSLMLKEHITEIDEVSEVAYLSANAPHKSAWMSVGHERRGITVHNASSLRGMAQIAHETSRRLLGRSRQQFSVRRRARDA